MLELSQSSRVSNDTSRKIEQRIAIFVNLKSKHHTEKYYYYRKNADHRPVKGISSIFFFKASGSGVKSTVLLSQLAMRTQDVKHFGDVAPLGLQQAGQPATVVGEAHAQHDLQGLVDRRI
jgi:hypothetical protein